MTWTHIHFQFISVTYLTFLSWRSVCHRSSSPASDLTPVCRWSTSWSVRSGRPGTQPVHRDMGSMTHPWQPPCWLQSGWCLDNQLCQEKHINASMTPTSQQIPVLTDRAIIKLLSLKSTSKCITHPRFMKEPLNSILFNERNMLYHYKMH